MPLRSMFLAVRINASVMRQPINASLFYHAFRIMPAAFCQLGNGAFSH